MTLAQPDAVHPKLVGGLLCLDFANTVSWRGTDDPQEYLNGYGDLLRWSRRLGILDDTEYEMLHREAERSPGKAEEVHGRAVVLREAIYGVLSAVIDGGEPEAEDLDTMNGELSEALKNARIVPSEEGFSQEFPRGTSLEQLLWPIAKSASDLLLSDGLDRVRRCASDECRWLFLDTSRNRSRRWCDMRDCGNRMKARRHYSRKRGTGQPN
jgi:predicted RNA-binding Zn ribbon-like protein